MFFNPIFPNLTSSSSFGMSSSKIFGSMGFATEFSNFFDPAPAVSFFFGSSQSQTGSWGHFMDKNHGLRSW